MVFVYLVKVHTEAIQGLPLSSGMRSISQYNFNACSNFNAIVGAIVGVRWMEMICL